VIVALHVGGALRHRIVKYAHRQAQRLAGFQGHAMDHYAWISQPSDHTGCQIARAFRRATRQQNRVALGQSAMQHPLKLLGIVGHDPERQRGVQPSSSTAAASTAALLS
jgi:hypothetical protein